jgi:hypothetical protein
MEEKREKDLKDLSQLIVSALTRDEGVMSALADLKKRKVIEPSTLLGLALKINDLLELSGATISEEEAEETAGKTPSAGEGPAKAPIGTQSRPVARVKAMIDGRELSYQETLFEEWAIANFNEKEWLKKTGLAW